MFNRGSKVSIVLLTRVASIVLLVTLSAISASHAETDYIVPVADGGLTKDDIIFYIHQRLEDSIYDGADKAVLKRYISIDNAFRNAGDETVQLLDEIWDAPARSSDELGEIVSLALKLDGDVSCLVPKVSRRLANRSGDSRFINSAIEFLGKHGKDQDIDTLALLLKDNATNQDRHIDRFREKVVLVLAARGGARHLPLLEDYVTRSPSDKNRESREKCNYAMGRIELRSLEKKLKQEESEQNRKTFENQIRSLRTLYPPVHVKKQKMTLHKLMHGPDAVAPTNQPVTKGSQRGQ